METHFEVVSPSLHEGGQDESRQNSLLQKPLDSSGDTVNAAVSYTHLTLPTILRV